MTTESAQAGQDAHAKIWAELDAADAGKPATEAAAATPVVEQQPAVQTAAKPDASLQAAAPAQAADAGAASVDPKEQVLLDKINGLESQLQQMTGRVRKVEGRFGELNGQLQQTARETAASGAAAPSASEIRAAQGSPEKMTALKRDYPEFGAAMEAALDERTAGLQQQLAQLSAIVARQPAGAVTAADVANLRNELTVELQHAGWKETVVQPEFTGWIKRQPREVQMLAESDSPQDAIRLLDLHAESRKAKPNNNQRLESAAAIPAGRSSSNHAAKPVEDMNKGEYWRYLDQQEASQRSQQG